MLHQEKSEGDEPDRHVIITCYDDRIDGIVSGAIHSIRMQGGALEGKDIVRLPGGVHMLVGKTDCRVAFYELLTSWRDIARTTTIHIWPHTNCRYCGIHLQEKLGSGAQSDLRFHVKSAEKLLAGATHHFSRSHGPLPTLDVRIILTTDQRMVTIEEAHELLPHVPAHGHHGSSCFAHVEHDIILPQATI